MNKLLILLLVVLSPLAFKGIYHFIDDDEVVYKLFDLTLGGLYDFNTGNEKISSWNESTPRLMQLGKDIYRVRGESIVVKGKNGIYSLGDDYDCSIFNSSNWLCTIEGIYDDFVRSEVNIYRRYEMQDGEFTVYTSDWDIEKMVNVAKLIDVSWLEYVSVGCQWALIENNGGLLRCLGHIYFD